MRKFFFDCKSYETQLRWPTLYPEDSKHTELLVNRSVIKSYVSMQTSFTSLSTEQKDVAPLLHPSVVALSVWSTLMIVSPWQRRLRKDERREITFYYSKIFGSIFCAVWNVWHNKWKSKGITPLINDLTIYQNRTLVWFLKCSFYADVVLHLNWI